MKIVIPGGSGQVGTLLAHALANESHEVVVLRRDPEAGGSGGVRRVHWDGVSIGPWADELDGADVVVNLAERSVNCRYNAGNRRAIMDSRTESTRVLAQAIASAASPPATWLQASTATIYAHRYDAPNDERGALGGNERPRRARAARARRQGGRRSPVHVVDSLRGLHPCRLLADRARGDVRRRQRRLAQPAAECGVHAHAASGRTETELILKSRRVVSGRLLGAGFTFGHPTWPEAARDL